MDAQQYQNIKDLAYQKIQARLNVTPSIREEVLQKFTDWFQGLVIMGKMASQMVSESQTEEMPPEMPGEEIAT